MRTGDSTQGRLNTVFVVAFVLLTLLCSAAPSHAEVIYKSMYVYMVDQGTYHFDFNNDGVTDLTFALNLHQNSCDYLITAVETPAHGNGAEGKPPTPLQAGDQIGTNQEFFDEGQTMASLTPCGHVTYRGPWPHSEVRYLGVSFLINGETHYAWASVEFDVILFFGPPKLVAKLTGYAYETVPGMPINAGQTK